MTKYRYECDGCGAEHHLNARQSCRQFSPIDNYVLCPTCLKGELVRLELLLLEGALLLGVLGRMTTAEEEEELCRLAHAGGDIKAWIDSKKE